MDESQDTQDTVKETEGSKSNSRKPNNEQADTNAADNADNSTEDNQASEQDRTAESSGDEEQGEVPLAVSIELLTEQLASAKEDQLRTLAEMQNLRRRSERDVENAHKFGLEKLINGLLPMLDNFDRAISAVPEDAATENEAVKALLEGVELTRKSAVDVLARFSVEVLEPFGEPFDPQFHEAMTMVPSTTAEPNSVVDVLQKGYTLNGRLLRAAMVVVAKAPE